MRPHIGQKITQAAATYQTRYGKLSAGWKTENGKLLLDVEIPANTTATIYIPSTGTAITENDSPLSASAGLQVAGTEKEYVVVKAGSGTYRFSAPWKPAQPNTGN
ncbi:alpha-L-rhamnosidase C-terminal domain-containing protein [Paraflavitalea speifideaquila]|uniref:alpha-L-rhamnosidase C-terminal domain-containing protein n=1 Tax=Paraflavitalea speifideaquila TaxID=3076558 RepID=UPI0028E8B9D3|nr:alpha-L-rhamnosidase C-terminal domain-containing protein [Paraflavitalea speifideiaquila]